MTIGLVEYGLWERQASMSWLVAGMLMILTGELIRKTAILTAKENFSHQLAVERSEKHELITRGIYGHIRHPSYLGFCMYALGTQIWLGNRLSTLLFVAVLWKFMSDRISIEDALLYQFFGNTWAKYRESTWSGIPYVP